MDCTKLNCAMQTGTVTENCGENCPWRTTAKISDLISRAAALDTIDGIKPMQGNMEQLAMKALCWAAVKTTPAVDAVPVRHGKWEERRVAALEETSIDAWQSAKCTNCGKYNTTPYIYSFTDYQFCPNCGAKMDATGMVKGITFADHGKTTTETKEE